MIRQLAQCPFYKDCEIALDDSLEVSLNPEKPRTGACPHLIWVDGRYSQWEPGDLGVARMIGSTEFRWDHPGFGGFEEYDRLIKYLKELVTFGSTWEFAPAEPFQVVALFADEKGTDPRGQPFTLWDLDGQALFAQSSTSFLAAVPACLERQSAAWQMPEDEEK